MASKNQYYKQCVLQKKIDVYTPNRIREMTTYIPEAFAKVGKYLQILEGGEWSDGWKVVLAGKVRLDEAYVQERSRDYKHTREASDV